MNTKRLEAQIRGAFNDADRQAYQIEVQEVGGDRLLIFVGYYTDGVHENEVEAYVHHAASEEEIVEALDEAIACAAGERPEHRVRRLGLVRHGQRNGDRTLRRVCAVR